jgi:predicted nucleotidyltransferase
MKKKINTFNNLKPLFSHFPIDVVYLYGSVAQGKADKLSDFDFGILFSQGLSTKKRFNLRLELFGKIGKHLGVNEENIDVIDLQEAPLLLQFNVISGKIIYCKNEAGRVVFETYVMGRYHDEHYYYDRDLLEVLEKIKRGDYFERRISYP